MNHADAQNDIEPCRWRVEHDVADTIVDRERRFVPRASQCNHLRRHAHRHYVDSTTGNGTGDATVAATVAATDIECLGNAVEVRGHVRNEFQ